MSTDTANSAYLNSTAHNFTYDQRTLNHILNTPTDVSCMVRNQRTLNHISTSQLREPTIMLLFLFIHILGLYSFAQGQGERCFDLNDKRSLFFLESSCEARLPRKSRESLTDFTRHVTGLILDALFWVDQRANY